MLKQFLLLFQHSSDKKSEYLFYRYNLFYADIGIKQMDMQDMKKWRVSPDVAVGHT
jgi:hypothetical protein